MTTPRHAWMVRAGNDNQLVHQVEEKQAIAIGWCQIGDISDLKTREEFKDRFREALAHYSSTFIASSG